MCCGCDGDPHEDADDSAAPLVWVLVAVLAVVLGGICLIDSGKSAHAKAASPDDLPIVVRPQWETKVRRLDLSWGDSADVAIEHTANEMGRDGWQLVDYDAHTVRCIFQRRK